MVIKLDLNEIPDELYNQLLMEFVKKAILEGINVPIIPVYLDRVWGSIFSYSGGDLKSTLASIQIPTLVIGINSDILCPLAEQKIMEDHMPNATLVAIDSMYGHDGFIIETAQITTHLKAWLNSLI